jgi:HlyD family secretion protein
MKTAHRLFPLCHQSERTDSSRRRRGRSRLKVVAWLALASGSLGAAAWYFAPGMLRKVEEAPLVGEVVVGRFVHEIVERGDVRSSNNVEVRCEVQMRSVLQGTAILEIVPEGTFVQAGDFIARLDDSTLQNDLQLQIIDCNASAAAVIQARTAVETAKLSLEEYKAGTYKQEVETIESEIFVAEENFRRAEEYLKYSARLAAKGYVTPIQLEADKFAVEKAQKELDVARTKLAVLQDYTREKSIKQFEAALRTAEAQLSAALETDSVETAMLNKIKAQIAKCTILAPKAGQVVYANDSNRGGEDTVLIEEGRTVRERQVIVRLPNPQQMQVLAKVNESRIDLVKPGMKARVAVDALPGVELTGRVKHVSEYPLQQYNSYTSHIKEYATEIEILDPPAGLRPGMTAQTSVIVDEREAATQVPVQSVFERDGRYYCFTHGADGVQARQIQVGPTNDKFVVVEAGLNGGEQVVIAPRQFANRVTLPEPIEFAPRAERPIVKAVVDDETQHLALKKDPAPRSTPRRKPQDVETSHETAAATGAGL